jgi:hypothetical protein
VELNAVLDVSLLLIVFVPLYCFIDVLSSLEYSLYGNDELNDGFDGESGKNDILWDDACGERVSLMFLADFAKGIGEFWGFGRL